MPHAREHSRVGCTSGGCQVDEVLVYVTYRLYASHSHRCMLKLLCRKDPELHPPAASPPRDLLRVGLYQLQIGNGRTERGFEDAASCRRCAASSRRGAAEGVEARPRRMAQEEDENETAETASSELSRPKIVPWDPTSRGHPHIQASIIHVYLLYLSPLLSPLTPLPPPCPSPQ